MQVLRQDPQDLAALQAAGDEVSGLLAEQKRRCYALISWWPVCRTLPIRTRKTCSARPLK